MGGGEAARGREREAGDVREAGREAGSEKEREREAGMQNGRGVKGRQAEREEGGGRGGAVKGSFKGSPPLSLRECRRAAPSRSSTPSCLRSYSVHASTPPLLAELKEGWINAGRAVGSWGRLREEGAEREREGSDVGEGERQEGRGKVERGGTERGGGQRDRETKTEIHPPRRRRRRRRQAARLTAVLAADV